MRTVVHGDEEKKGPNYICEEKTIQMAMYKYNEKDPYSWMQVIRKYLIGRVPEVKNFLLWVESLNVEVDDSMCAMQQQALMMDWNPVTMSQQLWAMLQHVLDGDVKLAFDNVEELNGAEAWRRLTQPLLSRTPQRRQELYKTVAFQKSVNKLQDVMGAVEVWERDTKMYVEAGGQQPSDEQRMTILTNMLPADTPMIITWELAKLKTYAELKEHLRCQTQFMVERTGGVLRPMHAMEREPEAELQGEW